MKASLPSTAGTYVLVLYLHKFTLIRIGRLGTVAFKRGWYFYVGSALGPGGLAARLKRHLEKEKKRHWHIDYLRTAAAPKEIWICRGEKSLEHLWAAILTKTLPASRPVLGFGCSDCRCASHLFYSSRYPDAVPRELKGDRMIIPP